MHRGAVIRLLGCLWVLPLLTACAPPDHRATDLGRHADLMFLDRTMVTDETVTVAPDHYWGEHPNGGYWSFRNSASLLCAVHRAPQGELAFLFKPDDATARFHFRALWNGEPIIQQPAQPSPHGTTLVIPRELVKPGSHVLTLRRDKGADRPADRSHHDNGFLELGWSLGDDRHLLRLEDRGRLRYFADFLSRGLTGVAELQLAGSLFVGNQRAEFELATDNGGSMSLMVENGSSAPATFTVTTAGKPRTKVVAPDSRSPFEVALPVGASKVSFGVAGVEKGLFLWGAPYLRHGRDLPGPVVLITLDTTRRDALSPYGGPPEASPHIQEFAGHATVFDNAHAVSPWTLPSHASMFTGMYPSQHGAGVSRDHLPMGVDTVAEVLRSRGYITAGFAGGELCSTRWGIGQGFALYRNPEGFETRGDRLTDHAITFLERHHDDPMFLFVNYFDPHALYEAPEEFQTRFSVARHRQAVGDVMLWRELAKGSNEAWRAIISGEAEASPEALAYVRASYLAEVAFMDHEVGRLLGALREHGLYDRALIVLASDHGEYLGERGFFSHCCRLDPELTEVPLLVKWPHQAQPRRVDELVSHVDLFSAMVLGKNTPRGEGQPSTDVWLSAARQTVLMEEHESRIHPLFANMMIARHLYGLQRLDSRQVVWDGGVSCSERSADGWVDAPCGRQWRVWLNEALSLAGEAPVEGAGNGGEVLSEEERARLEALGYVR